ncbi:hypothetical protein TNCV_3989441 [Trichonephila clavipes]|nr:hypothetical protein TNCV_3989441 [Trichonephila clavipes]
MAHASGSENLRSVTHNRSDDRFVEQNFVPDRKFTPSGDELFKHSMNSDRFFASLFDDRQKLILRLETTLVVEPEFKQGNVVLQIRDYNGKSLILRNNGSIISKHC